MPRANTATPSRRRVDLPGPPHISVSAGCPCRCRRPDAEHELTEFRRHRDGVSAVARSADASPRQPKASARPLACAVRIMRRLGLRNSSPEARHRGIQRACISCAPARLPAIRAGRAGSLLPRQDDEFLQQPHGPSRSLRSHLPPAPAASACRPQAPLGRSSGTRVRAGLPNRCGRTGTTASAPPTLEQAQLIENSAPPGHTRRAQIEATEEHHQPTEEDAPPLAGIRRRPHHASVQRLLSPVRGWRTAQRPRPSSRGAFGPRSERSGRDGLAIGVGDGRQAELPGAVALVCARSGCRANLHPRRLPAGDELVDREL